MTLPGTRREPGIYHSYVFLQKRGRLAALPQRVMLVGEMSDGIAEPGKPVQVMSEASGDRLFGAGSVLALMARTAFAVLRYRDSIPQIWATPVAEPTGDAAVTTLSVTGTAASSGVVELSIGPEQIKTTVLAGWTPEQIASAMGEEINRRVHLLGCMASVNTNDVACRAICRGVNGNDVRYAVKPGTVDGVSIAMAQTTTGAGAIDLVGVLDDISLDYHGWAVSNHTADDVIALSNHLSAGWAIDGGAHCGWGFIGTTDTPGVAQALAAAANKIQTVVAACTSSPSTPAQIAAAVATLCFSAEAPNHNFDDAQLPIAPPSEAAEYQSGPELESLLEGGVTPLAISRDGSTARVVKLQTTRVRNDAGDADDTQTDIVIGKVSAYLAQQKQLVFRRLFREKSLTDETVEGIIDAALGVHYEAYKAGYIEEPDITAVTAAIDPNAPGRLVMDSKHSPLLPLHQLYLIHESQI